MTARSDTLAAAADAAAYIDERIATLAAAGDAAGEARFRAIGAKEAQLTAGACE